MHHLAAFAESVAPVTVLQPFAAVPDPQFTTQGDDFRVPTGLAVILGASSLCAAASTRAQVASPTLRIMANLDVEPIVSAAVVYGSPPEGVMHPEVGIPVTPNESLNFLIAAPAGAAALHYGLVWLGDGPQAPQNGQLFQVRATSAIAQTTTTWVNGVLTFDQVLPVGRYAVVGMRARSADAVAARLVFGEQAARPGVMCVNAVGDEDIYWQRNGRMGNWGEFESTNPPTLDVLGGAAAAQTIILDLMRVR